MPGGSRNFFLDKLVYSGFPGQHLSLEDRTCYTMEREDEGHVGISAFFVPDFILA